MLGKQFARSETMKELSVHGSFSKLEAADLFIQPRSRFRWSTSISRHSANALLNDNKRYYQLGDAHLHQRAMTTPFVAVFECTLTEDGGMNTLAFWLMCCIDTSFMLEDGTMHVDCPPWFLTLCVSPTRNCMGKHQQTSPLNTLNSYWPPQKQNTD
ncbi:hypothetical protein PROFUN_11915 [Planoprotostelium fungivorum]|uniref:Uncharacterized protein n=1 Tax=Planoprotostelium fungivorum TaxID=1890364 RepID=A0A2P6N8Q9_9EUKA|nr:hypothetical protein PROFUN_11915 [Planoprotostelium fungivorum]